MKQVDDPFKIELVTCIEPVDTQPTESASLQAAVEDELEHADSVTLPKDSVTLPKD